MSAVIPPEVIKAAQDYDQAHRDDGKPFPAGWTRVPDDQVRRLLAGAFLALGGVS